MAHTRTHEVGSDIGPYRIEEVLGRGGMGVVYRATDTRLGRPVALKLLSPELSEDHRFRARFERESRLAASIDHPGIVPIYEARDIDGLMYIAMRFVDGSDLAQMLRREGRLEPARALHLIGQLADALDAAHARGLIHRDVKPSNALIAGDGPREHVYLADFGLTRTSGAHSITATGQVMGTAAYMAPEVLRGEQATAASDLYALGCVLFECLTGEVPFAGANAAAVIYGHLETPPPRPGERAADLPAALDSVLVRALGKQPAERFESGAAMVAAARAARVGAASKDRRPAPGRRSRMVALALGAVAAAAGVTTLLGSGSDGRIAEIRTDALAIVDPGERSLRARVELAGPPSAVAAAPGAIWVADDRDGTVARIDPATHTIRQTISVGHGPSALAAVREGAWVANRQDGTVSLISAATNQVVDTVRAGSPSDVCVFDDDVWIAGAAVGAVVRMDPDSQRRRVISIDANASRLACGAGGVWAVGDGRRLTQISPATNSVLRTVDVGPGSSAVAVAAGSVWVANSLSGTVTRVDPGRGVVTATIEIGLTDEPIAISGSAGAVWIANRHGRTVARIDPKRAILTERFKLGNEPRALAIVDDRLAVAVAATGAGHRGGTLRVDYPVELDPFAFDPALAYSPEGWQALSTTNDGLTTFRRAGGAAGSALVPNLAEALPEPSDGGRTYTFTVRRGVRFSTGEALRPSDLKRGIERSTGAKPKAYGLFEGIASITADDAQRTIVIRLKRADPDFLYRLALPFASAVPSGTPPPPSIVPATGPYRIARYDAARGRARLERNRFFASWSSLARPPGYPDAIEVRFRVSGEEAVDAVREGRTDYASITTGTKEVPALRRRAPGLIREAVQPQTMWLFLNTRVPPFNRADARRAVNLAIDRRAAVKVAGGERSALAACHILPPTVPGFRSGCTTAGSGPDLAAARALVKRSGTSGARVMVWTGDAFSFLTPLLTRTLRTLGYRTRVKTLPVTEYFPRVADSSTRAQAGPMPWVADYPSASSFLGLFMCRNFVPRSKNNTNTSQYCDARADALMREAGQRQATDPRGADALWAQAEDRVLGAAPVIPLFHRIQTDVVSSRLRNDQYSPQWGMLLDQAWVR